MNTHIAIFASGSGTNAENIIQSFSKSKSIEVSRARLLKVPELIITKKEFSESEYYVLTKLRDFHIDFIVLAGFLLQIPKYLIQAYPGAIINIHPALLPRFGGKGMYGDHVHKAVVEAGEKESGITIHYVNEHYDSGAIIHQEKCAVDPADTYDFEGLMNPNSFKTGIFSDAESMILYAPNSRRSP